MGSLPRGTAYCEKLLKSVKIEALRAVGGSSDREKGRIPLHPFLTADESAFYDFYLWKIVDFRKNQRYAPK